MNEKRCPQCDEIKRESDFYRSSKSKDGLQWVCKSCSKQRVVEWKRKHHEELNAREREFWASSPEWRAYRAQYERAYRAQRKAAAA